MGCVSDVDSNWRTIFVADAHRGEGQRFVVRAKEKLTAFVEIESAMRAHVTGALRFYSAARAQLVGFSE